MALSNGNGATAYCCSLEADEIKLSNPFVPSRYELSITVDLDRWTYEGTECIQLVRDRNIPFGSQITLHMASTINVLRVEGGSIASKNSGMDTITFELSEDSVKDGDTGEEIKLTVHFSHEIQEELHGFYRVKYRHERNDCRMASTHFEPTSARRFFICQDEPGARTSFSLKVRIPTTCTQAAKLTVLSNTPLHSRWEEGGYIYHQFDPISQCPPYLLACVIGELECVSTVAGASKIPISVYATPGKTLRASFPLKIVSFALEFFENFFQYPFPLPKLDVVAVPDFPIGGMENWGCICCVETILLNDDATTSIEAKERVAELLCHEVSHNWFGNLVGINWWDGLWLKEGFASWCGYFAANAFCPSWHSLENGMWSVAQAKAVDQYDNSHPVEVQVKDPSNITEIFDRISYDKGMGLVWMLEAFLGEKWSPAVAHYIRTFAFKGTKTNHLWMALEESSGEQIMASMKTFTSNLGLPLVHIQRIDSETVTVRQEACTLATTSRKKGTKVDTVWTIPITFGGTMVLKKVMLEEEGPVNVDASLKDFPFLVANFQARGFYRVRYDDKLFQSLLEADHYPALTVPDRCALLSDVLASAYMGFPDLQRLGKLCRVVRMHETETAVLKELITTVMSITSVLKDSPNIMRDIRLQQLSFMIPMAECYCTIEAQKEGEQNATLQLRQTLIISTSLWLIMNCYDPAQAVESPLVHWAIEQAKNFFHAHRDESRFYRIGTLGVCLAVYNRLDPLTNPEDRQEQLLGILHEVDLREELIPHILTGLCASTHPSLVEELLVQCITNVEVRSQYGGNLFFGASQNPSFQRNQLWMFFCKNFNKIKDQWGAGQFRIQTIVECVGGSLYGDESLAEFEYFFTQHSLEKAQMTIKRTAENIRIKAWLSHRWSPEEFAIALSNRTP